MNGKTSMVLAMLLMILGIGVLSYPTLSDYVNRLNGSVAIQDFSGSVEQENPENLALQRQLAQEYNDSISRGEEIPEGYAEILDFGNGIMGYLQIPVIGVNLAIYHGVGETELSKGVGHLPQSGFPIGGAGNHSVLAGHTGLPSGEFFDDLTELEIGNVFYVTILEETLAYQVDQIRVVLPSETEDLAAVPGEDHCTLLTCTPYGINSHRLLVRGRRVELDAGAAEQLQEELEQQTAVPAVLVAAAGAIIILLVCIAVVIFRKGKR